jgi:exonuclease SbcC
MRQLEEERRNQFEERQRVLTELEAIQQKLNALGQTEETTLEELQTERTDRQHRLNILTKKIEAFDHDFEIVKKETWKEEERLTLMRQQLSDAMEQYDSQKTTWNKQLEVAQLNQGRYEQLADRIDQRTNIRENLQREEEEGVRLRHRIQMIEGKLGNVAQPDLQSIETKVNEAKELYERASEHLITSQEALSRHRQIISEWDTLRKDTASEEQKLETIKLIAETGKGINPQKDDV